MSRTLRAAVLGCCVFGALTGAALADPVVNIPIAPPAPTSAPPAPGTLGPNGQPVVISGPTVSSQETTAFHAANQDDPYFQPKGIPLGGPFRLYPSLTTTANYDDNVYRTPAAELSDYYFDINPALVLDYNTSRARLDLYADADIFQYTRLTQVDYNNFEFGLQGGYDISQETQTADTVSYAEKDEALSSPNSVGFQAAPTQYDQFDASGKTTYKPNRVGITLGYSYDTFSYQNVPLIGGGFFGNKDRDNKIAKGSVEVSYDFSPGYSGFLRATLNNDAYDRNLDRSGIHRSSNGYETDAGVDLLLGDLVKGELFTGYIQQNYDQNQTIPLRDLSGLDFGADVTWFPTDLMTVKLGASRTFVNTTLRGASAGDDRNVNLSAVYALTRTIDLTAKTAYDDVGYKGTLPFRDDKTFRIGAGGKWLISHYISFTVDYDYTTRSSTLPATKYNDNLISLGLNLQI